MRYKGRWIPDPVITEINVGNGMNELRIGNSEVVKKIDVIEFKPRKQKPTKEERAKTKRHNNILMAIATLPTMLCIMAAVWHMSEDYTAYRPVAITCYAVTAFILIANIVEPKKGK